VETAAYDAPGWGVGELWLRNGVLVHHELPRARPPAGPGAGQAPPLQGPDRPRAGQARPLHDRLAAYFAGERAGFQDVELDLEGCTPFHGAIVEALRAVPWGETVTYGELAALAGYPNAHRAAGTVCAQNRFPLVVPCHRVVAAGSLGRYGALGVPYKRRLLEHEGAL
jgi:methylated-DNA-[protein]-cysteine S-methyltransferase